MKKIRINILIDFYTSKLSDIANRVSVLAATAQQEDEKPNFHKIVGTKDNIEKKVLDYIDVRMNDKSMIRVIKFSVSIKSGKYTAYDWTYKPTYR